MKVGKIVTASLIILLGLFLILVALTSCGSEPAQASTVIPVAPVYDYNNVVANQYDLEVTKSGKEVEWEKIENPTLDCSARRLTYSSGLHHMECVFVRCNEYPVISCVSW